MGGFTENLLKLTEFPFSYSLIGLLALIFGHGIDPEEFSFAKIGPLLVLMGFVATTLSICDPVGALQRLMLDIKGRAFAITGDAREFLSERKMWGEYIQNIFPGPYLFSIVYSPEGIMKRSKFKIDWDLVERQFLESKVLTPKLRLSEPFYYGSVKTFDVEGEKVTEEYSKDWEEEKRAKERLAVEYEEQMNKMGDEAIIDMGALLDALKDQTIKTKWITAEIDKITALLYFMVIISLFIIATFFIPDLLPKFAQSFGHVDSAKIAILIFSFSALIAVTYMFRIRNKNLQAKALIVFEYLTSLGAIKTSRKKFKATLEDIERYLNDNHWALAEYWVKRIQVDYSELFLESVKEAQNVTNRENTGMEEKGEEK